MENEMKSGTRVVSRACASKVHGEALVISVILAYAI